MAINMPQANHLTWTNFGKNVNDSLTVLDAKVDTVKKQHSHTILFDKTRFQFTAQPSLRTGWSITTDTTFFDKIGNIVVGNIQLFVNSAEVYAGVTDKNNIPIVASGLPAIPYDYCPNDTVQIVANVHGDSVLAGSTLRLNIGWDGQIYVLGLSHLLKNKGFGTTNASAMASHPISAQFVYPSRTGSTSITTSVYTPPVEVIAPPNSAITVQGSTASAIQQAINSLSSGDVYVPAGLYMVDATTNSIKMKNNVNLWLHDNAILRAIPNSWSNYQVVDFRNVQNAMLIGGQIEGERALHTSPTNSPDIAPLNPNNANKPHTSAHGTTNGLVDEWGHCIDISGAYNCTIRNTKLSKAWGDGIYTGRVGMVGAITENVLVENVTITDCRRQGISVCGCKNLVIRNCSISGINGVEPSAGIDVEPNNKGEDIVGLVIEDLFTKNCLGGGFNVYLIPDGLVDKYMDIKVLGHRDEDSLFGTIILHSTGKNTTADSLVLLKNLHYTAMGRMQYGVMLQNVGTLKADGSPQVNGTFKIDGLTMRGSYPIDFSVNAYEMASPNSNVNQNIQVYNLDTQGKLTNPWYLLKN